MSQQNLRHRNTDQSERVTSYHLLLKFPLSQASSTSLIHAASKVGGDRPKGKKTTATDAAVQAELAAVKKKTAEHAARGAAPGGHEDEDQRPKGEAGDKKNGFKFNLPVAMGLEDDAEVCEGDCGSVSRVTGANEKGSRHPHESCSTARASRVHKR
ncbi:hypothetical protein B0H14DRAFT_2579783 [Mycena olivaceomarginata]|nr:hypothetical protein B0H14DRAFT_2579783 [Mycena olivaceomarginata]